MTVLDITGMQPDMASKSIFYLPRSSISTHRLHHYSRNCIYGCEFFFARVARKTRDKIRILFVEKRRLIIYNRNNRFF